MHWHRPYVFYYSWNVSNLPINGLNATNLYLAAGSYLAKINGFWYIVYSSTVAWGHFESNNKGVNSKVRAFFALTFPFLMTGNSSLESQKSIIPALRRNAAML
jgi:hypothetical protein